MQDRITKRSVEAIEPGETEVFLWDDAVPGFGVRVKKSGARIYVLKYRAAGKQRWITLGRHGEITAEEARKAALRNRGLVADGKDLAAERDAEKGAPTVQQLGERYLVEHAEPHKKPRSVEEDRRNLKLHVYPALGNIKAPDVKRQDILKLQHKMRETPGAANLTMALLSKMFGLAEEWGIRPKGSNPAWRISKFKTNKRERFLSLEEISLLGKTLAKMETEKTEHPTAIAAIRLLLLTGCRLNEILSLQWSFVDFEQSCLRLPDSKTGAKVVRLGAPALDLLSGLPRLGNSPFVLPRARGVNVSDDRKRRVGAGHFVGLERVWQRVRKKIALDEVRLHDLRHTFASWSVMGGGNLYVTGKLLGHKTAATTARYSHVADDPLKAAADKVTGTLAAALAGARPAEVTQIARGGRHD